MDNNLSNQTVAGLAGDTTGIVSCTNANTTDTLTVAASAGQTYTFAGLIGAPTILTSGGNLARIALTIAGSGTQILSGSNSYTGATNISGGTLELGNVNAVQGSIVTDNVASNGLSFSTSGLTYNLAGLSGSGNIGLAGVSGGSLTLNVSGETTRPTPVRSTAPAACPTAPAR